MLNKRIYEPALAGEAPNGARPIQRGTAPRSNMKGNAKKRPPQRRNKQEKVFEIDPKIIMIAISAFLALILLVVMIVLVSNTNGKDILKENMTYASFEKDGKYYLSVNGYTLKDTFDNEIELTPALDNSFAYVIETLEDGKKSVYLLEKKKLTEAMNSPVDEIITLAKLKPGVVYRDGNNVNFFSKENDDNITRNDPSAANFIIAHDASAITYTTIDKDDETQTKLYVYTDEGSESYATNMCPVEISKGGKYLYAYGSVDETTKKLFLINTKEQEPVEIDTGFYEFKDSNINGDEIVYTLSTEKGFQTKIFSAKKSKSYAIGGGICKPMMTANTVMLSTFKETVFENFYFPTASDLSHSATYYVNKKFASKKLATYNGKLNSEGDVFYYTDVDDTLYSIEFGKKNAEAVERATSVKEFVITEKDNIYYIDEDKYLWFCKEAGGNKQIETEVVDLSFNIYSNILYFEIADDENIYSTEEGSGKEIVEFGRNEIGSLPIFSSNGQKRNYAIVKNAENESYNLYYTSTGKTFKLIEDECDNITY